MDIDSFPNLEGVQGVPFIKINQTRISGAVEPSEFARAIKENLA
jgi:predicted DsbA family dithiol-disulfide isomerase